MPTDKENKQENERLFGVDFEEQEKDLPKNNPSYWCGYYHANKRLWLALVLGTLVGYLVGYFKLGIQ